MRIGIVTPVLLFREFLPYFDGEDREYLASLKQNENGPAPSIIGNGFIKEGHFVRFFTLGPETRICRSTCVDIVTVNVMSGIRKYVKLNEFKTAFFLAKDMRPYIDDLDVLHAHWSYYTAMAAGRFAKKLPVFCTVRDWTSIIRSFLPNKGGIQWKVYQLINDLNFRNRNIHFIGNSPYTQALIQERIGSVVPCIMNPINNKFLLQGEKIYPNNLQMICIASSVDARKNIEKLLLAYKKLKHIYPGCLLTCIFGYAKTIDKNPFYIKWKENGLLDGVRVFKGLSHDDVFTYIDQSTMMVNPSLEETFGNTVIESMARKTPIVAGQKSGAIPYLIGKDERGHLCDVTSVDDIVRVISETYKNIDQTKKIATDAFNWIKSNNTLEAITQKHINLYSQYL